MKNTIDEKEVHKFGSKAAKWWNENDPEFKMLHKMNPIRLEYILKHAGLSERDKILDIGCGGGILSEPLARKGYLITGLEPALESVQAARQHAYSEGLNINYINSSLEDLAPEILYDSILLMDVLEHTLNQKTFLEIAASNLKPGGIMIISTINDTLLSKIFVKGVAEYILKLLPKGTHEVEKFISPELIETYLPNFKMLDITGFSYNILFKKFSFSKNAYMNYFCALQKG